VDQTLKIEECMSNLLLLNGDDHPEAAAKHLDDAMVLCGADHADGAAYLAGYVVESSLKSLVLVEDGLPAGTTRAFKTHNINNLSSKALHLAALPSARTAKYIPRQTAGHSLYDPVNGWSETLRYRAPGAITPQTAQDWVREAQAVFESTILPMRLDGVI
jgi:hypothetical protein